MAPGTTSVDGLFSNLDTTSLIRSLADVRRRPATLLGQRVTERTAALTSYQSLSGQALALQAAAASMADGIAFQARTVSLSSSGSLLASAASGAAVGTYDLTVDRLAQAHKIAADPLTDPDAALGFTGDIRIGGHTISLAAEDTLTDLRDAINRAGAGVSASVLHVSEDEHRLVLTALQSGAANALDLVDANGAGFLAGLGLLGGAVSLKHGITNGGASDYLTDKLAAVGTVLGLSVPPAGTVAINGVEVAVDLAADSLEDIAGRIEATVSGVTATVTSAEVAGRTQYRLELTGDTGAPTLADSGGVLRTLGVLTQGVAHELQAAQDSRFFVDGYAIERSGNQVDDAIEGLSLDLLQANPAGSVTLTVSSNPEAAVSALQQLVNSYNNVVNTINNGLRFDAETNRGGVFFGDYAILHVQSGLYGVAMEVVATLGGDWTLPSQLGLGVTDKGLLTLNAQTLRDALQDSPDGVLQLLTTRTEMSHPEVEFVSATADTEDSGAAGFGLAIAQAASRPTAQSAVLSGGITQTETLTLNGRYSITLQAGDSLQAAADRLNAVFDGNGLGLSATVVDDRLQVQSSFYGSSYKVSISSTLADGAGGTDLGGATAGTEAVYAGQDVAGTIGGKAATGWGQWLTSTTSPAKGLKVKVTSSSAGDKGVARISRGLASRMAAYAQKLTASDGGTLTRATEDVDDTISSLREEIARINKSADVYTETLQAKFAAAEAVLARNATLQSYLTSQFANLQSYSVDRSA